MAHTDRDKSFDEEADWIFEEKSDRTDDRHRRGHTPNDECEWWDDIVHAYEESFDNSEGE